MATRPDTIAPFIAKLLAPLPADVEQVDDKRFIRQLKEDASTEWRRAMRTVTVAKARLDYVRAQFNAGHTADESDAFAAFVREVDRQIAMPTTLKDAIKWKRQHVAVGADARMRAARLACIESDEARLTTTRA